MKSWFIIPTALQMLLLLVFIASSNILVQIIIILASIANLGIAHRANKERIFEP